MAATAGVIAWAERLPSDEITATVAQDVLAAARAAVIARAEQLGRAPADLACTLLVAVLRADGTALVAQLGDGAVVVRQFGKWTLALPPGRGEFVNETFFVTSPDATERLTARLVFGVDAVALCSDGVEHLVIDARTSIPHAPFFDKVVLPLGNTDPAAYDAFLESVIGSDRAQSLSDDDKSIVAAVMPSTPGEDG